MKVTDSSPLTSWPNLIEIFSLARQGAGCIYSWNMPRLRRDFEPGGVRRWTIVVFRGHQINENGPSRHGSWLQQTRAFERIASQQGGCDKHERPRTR